jgi:CHAD domain-containing protein
MPWAITSSSSTIRTFGIRASLAAPDEGYDQAVKRAPEGELRFDVDPGFALPDLHGTPLEPRTVTSTYYDTPDRRLLDCGITFGRRVESRSGVWTLELPSEEGAFELAAPGGPTRMPPSFLSLLPALLRGGAALEPIVKLRTRRTGYSVTRDSETVEVVLDSVAVLDGTRIAGRFAEVEAEAVAGNGSALAAIGKELRRAGADRSRGVPRLRRALAGEGGPGEAPADRTASGRLRSLLAEQYRELLANDPGVRLGEDPEALHRARVATRRARALLRAADGLVEAEWAEGLRAELKWLGALLGPVRDLDVLVEHIDSEVAGLDRDDARAFGSIRRRLGQEHVDTRDALLGAMSEPRYFRLLDLLEPAADGPVGNETVSLEQIAKGAFKRTRRAMKALPPNPTDEELHRVRIEVKRARYAGELAEPALGKAGARFVRAAKDVQDVIGDHQDAYVAEIRIRELVASGRAARSALVAGRLIERQRLRKKAARKALPAAWRSFEKTGRAAFK